MESLKYIEEMRKIQDALIDFIDDDCNTEESFTILIEQLNKHLIGQDYHQLKTFFGILINIANNHHHCANFFEKVEKIIQYFKNEIKKYFSNSELFKIFKSNKRILLYLFDEQMLIMEEDIISKIQKYRYYEYFAPEIAEKDISSSHYGIRIKDILEELPENFKENRKKGENENYICELIRNDSIEDFIVYVNKNDYSLESNIKPSIYETNHLLLYNKKLVRSNTILSEQEPTLIEYAALFGSIQIFQFLFQKEVKMNSYIWNYAVCGQNAEIINIIEENKIHPRYIGYIDLFMKAISCHHNDVARYILNNYLPKESEFAHNVFVHALKTNNFDFIQNDLINETALFNLIKFGYYHLVDIILKNEDVDENLIKEFDKGLFYMSVKKKNIEHINLLMKYDQIDINFVCNGQTALHLAVEKNYIEIVSLLLKSEKIDVDFVCNGQTALHLAVEKNYIEIVNLLLKSEKIDVNFVCNGQTALFLAIDKNNIEIVNLLLKSEKIDVNVPYVSNDGDEVASPLNQAVYNNNNNEIVKLLLANDKIDVNFLYTCKNGTIVEKKSSLYLAVEFYNIEIVKLLLENDNIDVNSLFTVTDDYNKQMIKQKSALYKAIAKENIDIVQLLLKNDKININAPHIKNKNNITTNKSSLYLAVYKRNLDIVRLLLENDKLDINYICTISKAIIDYFILFII